jgi:hypothetical protein
MRTAANDGLRHLECMYRDTPNGPPFANHRRLERCARGICHTLIRHFGLEFERESVGLAGFDLGRETRFCKQGHEQTDDRDHDQQLDERESAAVFLLRCGTKHGSNARAPIGIKECASRTRQSTRKPNSNRRLSFKGCNVSSLA